MLGRGLRGPKFGGKSVWGFNVMCPICEKGYYFAKEKGRDEVQKLMLKKSSLGINAWTHFWLSHTLFEQHENEKERLKQALGILKRFSQTISSTGTG